MKYKSSRTNILVINSKRMTKDEKTYLGVKLRNLNFLEHEKFSWKNYFVKNQFEKIIFQGKIWSTQAQSLLNQIFSDDVGRPL